jgi:hypothetical protein
MKINKALASLAIATSLVAAPVAAQATTTELRTATEVEGENLRGGFIIPLIALVAVVLGILVATGGGNDDAPESP